MQSKRGGNLTWKSRLGGVHKTQL